MSDEPIPDTVTEVSLRCPSCGERERLTLWVERLQAYRPTRATKHGQRGWVAIEYDASAPFDEEPSDSRSMLRCDLCGRETELLDDNDYTEWAREADDRTVTDCQKYGDEHAARETGRAS